MTYRTAFKIIGILSLATLALLAYAFSTYDPDSTSSIEFRKRRAIEAKEDSIANAKKEEELEKQRTAKERENIVNPKDRRKKIIEKQFSRWDGSHRTLAERIKSTMNDPDSFEHVETLYWDTGDNTIVVQTTFRGKNIYGGVVTNTVKAKVNVKNGRIVEVL